MNINLAVSAKPNFDGTFKAVIIIGDFVTEKAALEMAISGGAHIVDTIHQAAKIVEGSKNV